MAFDIPFQMVSVLFFCCRSFGIWAHFSLQLSFAVIKVHDLCTAYHTLYSKYPRTAGIWHTVHFWARLFLFLKFLFHKQFNFNWFNFRFSRFQLIQNDKWISKKKETNYTKSQSEWRNFIASSLNSVWMCLVLVID